MTLPSDGIGYWNDPAVAADLRRGAMGVSAFAKEVEPMLPRAARVLELGCGAGDDAAYFAEQGHRVLALDLSEPLVEMASQRFADVDSLQFRRADITRRLETGGESCDAVYARLSVHYFDDATTTRVLGEVFWVLRPGGRFFFLCRSDEDPLYGKGRQIDHDMYELDGEVRRFFSTDYCLDLMEDTGFVNIELKTGADRFYGVPSAYVMCWGTKL